MTKVLFMYPDAETIIIEKSLDIEKILLIKTVDRIDIGESSYYFKNMDYNLDYDVLRVWLNKFEE